MGMGGGSLIRRPFLWALFELRPKGAVAPGRVQALAGLLECRDLIALALGEHLLRHHDATRRGGYEAAC